MRGTWHGEHGSLDMFLHFAIPIDVIRHGFGKGQEPCLIRDAELSVNCLLFLGCEAAIKVACSSGSSNPMSMVNGRGKWRY